MIGPDYPSTPFRICDNTDEQQRIDVLQDIAAHGSNSPEIASLARVVRQQVGRDTSVRRIASEALLAIQCLEYHPHPQGEWFQPVQYTLKNGGNCEDLSTALAALLLALGIPARVAWITQSDRPLNHVVVRLENGLWADPSIWGAFLGEQTYDAIERVQIEGVTHPADLVFRASKEYPMISKRVKMKPAMRPAGLAFNPIRTPADIARSLGLPPPAPSSVLSIVDPANNSNIPLSSFTAVKGTAIPGRVVNVFVDVGGVTSASPVGTATADATGTWSLALPSSFVPVTGSVVVRASSIDATGDTVTTVASFMLTSPTAPTGTAPLSITSPPANFSGPAVSAIAGTAPAGTQVTVSLDGGAGIAVTADSNSNWKLPLTAALAPGAHTAVASSSTVSTGNTSVTLQFTITSGQPGQPGQIQQQQSDNTVWWALGIAAALGIGYMAMKKKGR